MDSVELNSARVEQIFPSQYGYWEENEDRSADAQTLMISTLCYFHDAETKTWFSFILLNGLLGDE